MAAESPMTVLDEVVVTGSREQTRLVETAASVSSIKEETIALDRPSHPMQVMSQMPGVAVAVTNGEGHQTSIRQPFTTSPVYLFLEDGIPSRSTGFFNHNALYELNIPQAGGIEVTKGPGSALYGSDAIGGLINVLTPTPPQKAEASLSLEAGDFGWRRALVSGGNAAGDDAWRASLNLTHTDGWRDKTAYDRQSGTLRWDRALDNQSVLKTVMSFSLVDQETGANSPLIRSDYENSPTKNYKPIAFRKVSAFRLSSNYEHETENTLVSITPYYRNNSMDLLASFTLNSDRTVYNSANQSFGVAAKWRRDFVPLRARLIAGIDVDYSPGSREEDAISVTTSGSGASQQFLAYSRGARVYDYKVAFKGISPYLQGEFSPLEALRVTAGLRYDHIGYSFDNNLSSTVTANGRSYAQAGDTSISYNHLSPKLGATLALSSTLHAYANYSHGFRAPSESQLFRPSSSTTLADAVSQMQSALQLKPIKADQYEMGLRGKLLGASYDVSVYDLTKKDDIVSARNTATNESVVSNAGETRHRGIELGLGVPLSDSIRVDAAYAHAKHTYEKWLSSQGNFSGKEMASAPRNIANTRLTWSPSKGNRVQLEWVRLGKYWLDDANTATYEGHTILTLRGNWQINKDVGLFASLYNLADKRWADSASISSSTVVYSPGMPRTLTAGVQLNWQ